MPELPEVETFKQYLDSTSLHQVIKVISVSDPRILELDEAEFKKALLQEQFESSERIGKNLFVKTGKIYVLFHFGMTGDMFYSDDLKDEPSHSRVIFSFDNGHYLFYISQRLFGKLNIITDLKAYIKDKKLGPDALNMTKEEFKTAIKRRSGNAKTVLMNQEVISGIGNIYSDEILFQTGIHPKTKFNTLSEEQLSYLFENIKKVLKYGIQEKGILENYSKTYLIPHRDKGGICPKCKRSIERIAINGRHGFFCPHCQPES